MEENNEAAKEAPRRTVTMKGRPLELHGEELKVGMPAPDFKAVDNSLLPVKFLRTFKGRVTVVSSVPSLDTGICDLQTRRFNKEAEALGPDVNVVTVSMDLPFAQARWCGAAGAKAVKLLSDHQKAEFGKNWGLLIKDLRLLARAVYVVDREGVIRYAQIVPEVAQEPDYEQALTALRALV
jgi:thioredoxin-dependent peroxiredoxin